MIIDLTGHESSVMIIFGVLMLILGIFMMFVKDEKSKKLIFPRLMTLFILLFGLFLAVGMGLIKPRMDKNTPYEIVAKGTFDRAEYIMTGGFLGRSQTVIRFKDGQVYILPGTQNVIYSRGEKLEILKNKGQIKIYPI